MNSLKGCLGIGSNSILCMPYNRFGAAFPGFIARRKAQAGEAKHAQQQRAKPAG